MTNAFCTAAAGLPRSCAAPAGGALSGGRGRLGAILISCLVSCLAPSVSVAETLSVPSERAVSLIEYLADQDGQGLVLRARYVMPALNGEETLDSVFTDMMHLCETDARVLNDTMIPPRPRIIVSISSVALGLGEINDDVVQYFEAYRIENDRCIWELF